MKTITGMILAASMAVSSNLASAETWTAYTFGPSEALPNVRGLTQVMDGIEEATDGEITFRFHLAGALPIKSSNITQAVGDGTIQFADDGFFQGNVPIAGLLRLPMLLQSEEEFQTAVDIMKPYVEAGFAKQGVVALGNFVFPFQVAFTKPQLTSLDEFAGKKMRVSSPEQAAFVKQFGGIPVTLGGPEVPPALQRGTIDGVFTASAGGGRIWGDMLDFNYRIPLNYFDGVYIVNKDAFDALSEEHQAAIRETVERLAPETTALIASEEVTVTDKLRENGMTVTVPSDEELARASEKLAPYWEEWAENLGPDAVEALSKVRDAIGR
uniref:TRAP transporter substrate-binding protein n=1 Tax=Roseovarius indicus TaxID=540747 RepID=UPI003B528BCC